MTDTWGWRNGSAVLPLQKTSILFLAAKLGGSQAPIPPAQRNLTPPMEHMQTCGIHTYRQTHTEITKINKIIDIA